MKNSSKELRKEGNERTATELFKTNFIEMNFVRDIPSRVLRAGGQREVQFGMSKCPPVS
jgi:hypothetical protein